MRLAVCALSAVLLSGCSWLGAGGNSAGHYGSGVYGADCGGYGSTGAYNVGSAGACGGAGGYGVGGAGYGAGAGYGQAGYGAGAGYGQGAGAGYGQAGAGYGQAGYGAGAGYGQAGYGAGAGYGQAGYGAGAGYGQAGYGAGAGFGQGAGYGAGAGYGQAGYGAGAGYGQAASAANGYNSAALGLGAAGAYGAAGYGQTTTLGAAAPYGTAVGGTQFGGTQFGTQGNVTTVAGAPIYVPQPYPSYYGVPQLRGVPVAVAGGGALPFGLEFGIGTNYDVSGDFVTAKSAGVASGGTLHVSATDAIGYDDAFDTALNYDVATTYDLNRSTTLLGRVGYSKADGNVIQTGSVNNGTTTETLFAEFDDLEQFTVEGGVRKYMGAGGYGSSLRPYVGATGGFTHTDSLNINQYSGDGSSSALLPNGSNVQQYVDGGWSPTASGVIGAEMAVGNRGALALESGIRWSDDLDTASKSNDRWSVPVQLRGRVAF